MSASGQRKWTDRDMRFDTGAGWLDLLATVGSAYGPAPVERVRTAADLAVWLRREGLTPVGTPTDDDLQRMRGLREALRPLALAAVDRRDVTSAQVEALQPYLDRASPAQATTVDGVPAVAPPRDVDDALARLAVVALTHLGGPERAHLGACDDDVCRMIFLDPTGRRRWCSAQICGVRARVRAHRARTAAT